LIKQMNKTKKTHKLLHNLSDTLLKIKEVELKVLEKKKK
jgi:hypothetical protein